MRFEFENTKPDITTEDLITDLRRVARQLDAPSLSQNAYRAHGSFSTTAAKKRFGTWNGALGAAGLTVSQRRDIPDDELFDNLREAWIKLGRQPRKREMGSRVSRFTHHPYVRRFGGWLPAMRAFVASLEGEFDTSDRSPSSAAGSTTTPRHPSLRLRFRVMQRDSFKCALCGCSPATDPAVVLHVDHIVPWSKGGETTLANLRALCSSCNLGKGTLAG